MSDFTDEQIGTDWWRVIENLGDEADDELVKAIVVLIEKGIHPHQVRDLVDLMNASETAAASVDPDDDDSTCVQVMH